MQVQELERLEADPAAWAALSDQERQDKSAALAQHQQMVAGKLQLATMCIKTMQFTSVSRAVCLGELVMQYTWVSRAVRCALCKALCSVHAVQLGRAGPLLSLSKMLPVKAGHMSPYPARSSLM